MKNKADRKVNRLVRKLNKSISEDVFGDRFFVRQAQKSRSEWGSSYYLYEFIDNAQPERNYIAPRWFSEFDILQGAKLWMEINDFIVNSDFWSVYRKDDK